jgi:pullulanase/glycogen debranching enzyme
MVSDLITRLARRWLLAALLPLLAALTGCGGGGGGSAAPPTAGPLDVCNATSHQTILAAVPSAGGGAGGATGGASTVRIHYNRVDSSYAGWTVYTYNADPSKPNGESMGAWPGRAPSGSDSFGPYWDVPVANAQFNFIMVKWDGAGGPREPSNWSGANADQQQFWKVADGNAIWKLSGDATNYKTNPLAAGTPDIETVRVHYKRFDGAYANWGLHLWPTNGINTAALPPGVTIDVWTAAVPFAQMPGYAVASGEIVFDIPVLNPQGDPNRKALEFIIHGLPPNQDNKDGRSDNIKVSYASLAISNKVGSVWLVQDDAGVYTAPPDTRIASTTESRAYWLTQRQLRWPRVDATGTVKLYHSATGQIRAPKDGPVSEADGSITLDANVGSVPADAIERFRFVPAGAVFSVRDADLPKLPDLHRSQLVLVQEDGAGLVQNATMTQTPGAFDDLYAAAGSIPDLGVSISGGSTRFKLWAPSAQRVSVCTYPNATAGASAVDPMDFDPATGVWSTGKGGDLSGQTYRYVVEVFVRGVGLVRNLVTDPYSVSLTTDSKRSFIADLDAAALKPAGWDSTPLPTKVAAQTDMVIYELHVRDFSAGDLTVSAANRGKYAAFTETNSNGMKHLAALSAAGLTDVHLLPVFDIATVPESGCVTPAVSGPPDGEGQQASVAAVKDADCFNWGYDPYHFNAPEGSYASDASDGAKRILEFRQMVQALHQTGLRVGMDVVYNHTTASGQNEKSVLDRVVPGYYHRLNATGGVEKSTCCDNTATEHRMMGKLMIDSTVLWAKHYRIDSFRFDLMGHQPRTVMEALKAAVNAATGRDIHLIGEGWNFGEVANNARFRQASQLELNGSGIGTFSDRARDHVRGGGPFDGGADLVRNQGYINGLVYDRNAQANPGRPLTDLMWSADIIKAGLAGSIRDYTLTTHWNASQRLEQLDYNGQPTGYVSQPSEVVNYVENHDNQTLFDINVYKLPTTTSREDRARVQILGAAINAFSQGVAYYHAGIDTLRSKSMDRNSYNSGDWFNRLDWTYSDNFFATGAPPQEDNGANWSVIKPLLANAAIKPTGAEIAWTRDAFRDLLRIRASSTLFRLRTADDIKQRLTFHNTGSAQVPTVLAAHLDGTGHAGAGFRELAYFVNVDKVPQAITIPALAGRAFVLHPVHAAPAAADRRAANDASYASGPGTFTVPARTAVVFVVAN